MSNPMVPGLLAAFPAQRILVVGDVILDEYLWGEVRRISPEAPVPVVEIRSRTVVPGGAANAAANVVSLAAKALLGGVVGHDDPADKLAEALRRQGVDPSGLIADHERMTTTKTRLIAHGQQVVRMDSEQRMPLSSAVEDALLHWAERHLPEVDACILSDYGKGVISNRVAEQIIRTAQRLHKPVVVDPKGTQYAKYCGATVVKPNIHEVQQVVREEIEDDNALLKASRQLIGLLGGAALLITRGEHGMVLFRETFEPVHTAAVARRVFDVTGAGDTVISTLALALAAGATLEQAMHLANLTAGIVVGKRGTATVTLEELREAALSDGTSSERA
ncbi:MAG TPA: D-glycero-beta-D-manno-heptose-7-phosphate kinase [Gemmataceae bacterium]|nr:D-glycero-beta-D-manno-heptose-7-phosphate kinase [Gemmataceae bacterium]